MTQILNSHKTGLALGTFFAVLHAAWSLAVAVIPGPLQKVLDWIFVLHQLNPIYKLLQFNPVNAVIVVILTFAVGYIIGFVFAAIWNRIAK